MADGEDRSEHQEAGRKAIGRQESAAMPPKRYFKKKATETAGSGNAPAEQPQIQFDVSRRRRHGDVT